MNHVGVSGMTGCAGSRHTGRDEGSPPGAPPPPLPAAPWAASCWDPRQRRAKAQTLQLPGPQCLNSGKFLNP